MKIRVLSDLHLDVNSRYWFKVKDQDVFTVIAGDTSGDPKQTIQWANKNLKQGIIVSGNHLVYNRRGLPIQDLREELHNAFPIDNSISYLDNETGTLVKEVDGILFIGTCLYTDMALKSTYNPTGQISINKNVSLRSMNDYRWGIAKMNGKNAKSLSPDDYVEWFSKAIENIDKVLTENENSANPKPVIIVTHHAPSVACISGAYVGDNNNCSYVSDLEGFIEKHTSIKFWIYGHIHDDQRQIVITRKDGSECSLFNNARGYLARCEDRNFNPNTFIDTETWKIEREPITKSQKAAFNKRSRELQRALAWFW